MKKTFVGTRNRSWDWSLAGRSPYQTTTEVIENFGKDKSDDMRLIIRLKIRFDYVQLELTINTYEYKKKLSLHRQ